MLHLQHNHLQSYLGRPPAALKGSVKSPVGCGFMANSEKRRLAVEEITYLGYCRGGGLMKPVVNKIQVLTAYPIPQMKRQVAGYYWRFILDFTSIAAPSPYGPHEREQQ